MQTLLKCARSTQPVVLDTRVVTGTGGGPDKTILNSPRYFTDLGYRMVCAYMHPPEDRGFDQLRKKAAAWGAPLLSIPDRGAWDWQVVTKLLHICRRERVQIWHGHDYKSNALGLLLRRFWPMDLVTTVHGWVKETRRTPLYYKVDKLCLPRFASVICVSPDLLERAQECGVSPERCVLIENAIDAKQFCRSQTIGEAKNRLGLPVDRLLIGGVGRLSPEKGFDILIRAVHQLGQIGLTVGLLLVGEGSEQERLAALSRDLGVEDRVHLLGYRTDARPIYEAMDVFALSSLREGLPNVLLEAMALEVPVVATRIAGVPRLIQENQNGLLVEPGSVDALARALRHLLQDTELRKLISQEGRHTIESRYSFSGRIAKIAKIYDELLRQHKTMSMARPTFGSQRSSELGGNCHAVLT